MSTTITTGLIRLSYCNVFTPKAAMGGGEPKYGTAILITKSDKETVKKIKDAIEEAKESGKAKWGGKIPTVLKTPLRSGDDEKPDDGDYANMYFLNANNSKQPGIVDKNRQAILDPNAIYSGGYARVNITFFAFSSNGNKGIACALNHLQWIKDGEALDGRVSVRDAFSDDFDDEDDSDLI